MSPHLRRRRDLEGTGSRAGGRSGAGDHSQSLPRVGLPMSTGASLDYSSNGARTSNAGGRVRRQGSGIDHAKDKSAPQSTHGAVEAVLDHSDSPKIGAYHGPISSITKHYFMVSRVTGWAGHVHCRACTCHACTAGLCHTLVFCTLSHTI
jgi:hypothetical protein